MTGTVTRDVSLAGPHGTMQICVGNVVWDVTLAPPAHQRRGPKTRRDPCRSHGHGPRQQEHREWAQ